MKITIMAHHFGRRFLVSRIFYPHQVPSQIQVTLYISGDVQDGTRVSLLVDQRLNAAGVPAENGTLKVPDATRRRSDLTLGNTTIFEIYGPLKFNLAPEK